MKQKKLTQIDVHDTDYQFAKDIYEYLKRQGNVENLTANNVYDVLSERQPTDEFIFVNTLSKLIKFLSTERQEEVLDCLIKVNEENLNFTKEQIDAIKERTKDDKYAYFEMLLKLDVLSRNGQLKGMDFKSVLEKGEYLFNEIYGTNNN